MTPTRATTSARAFWCIATGQGLSSVGMTTTLTALTVHFQHLPKGSAWVTALIVAYFLPATLLAAPVSAAFSRWSTNQVLTTSLVLRIVLTLVAAALDAEPLALLVCFILVGRQDDPKATAAGLRQTANKTAGMRYILLNSTAAPSVLLLALAIAFTAALPVAQSAYFLDERGVTPAQFSAVIAAFAAGRLIASALGAIITWPRSSQTALVGATILFGLSLLLSTAGTHLVITVLLFAIAGYCNTLQTLSIRSIVNQSVPAASLPQASTGLMAVNNGATIIGTIVGGAFVAATSGQLALQVAGGATAAIGVCAWAGRLRRES